jgi:CheY-like chemotaxis protein
LETELPSIQERATLLIVDDDQSLRRLLATFLRGIGFDVREADDGISALAEMRLVAPEIVISDLNMPGMTGFELLSIIQRRFPATYVIAMSAAFSGTDVPPDLAADAFYPKSSDMSVLFALLNVRANTGAVEKTS